MSDLFFHSYLNNKWYVDEKYKSHEVREVSFLDGMGSVHSLHQSDVKI